MITLKDEIKDKIESDDAASESEREFLYSLIRAIKPKIVVEIGTHKGMTALYMACALCDNGVGILHTTDPKDWEQVANVKKFPFLEKFIVVHKEMGEHLDINNIDFLFIDGYHEEHYVIAEVKHFLPKLSDNGVIVFHDCGGDNEKVGVNSAIEKLGLETAFIPTDNKMRIYGKFKP